MNHLKRQFFFCSIEYSSIAFAPIYTVHVLHRSVFCFLLLFVISTNSTGKSCHNQRIERLWRDVFGGCIVLFYELFSNLERCGILDPNDDIQLWCLHHVFIPVINSHLTNWKNSWVHHPLRTERNTTPMQLWITGLQRLWGTGSTVGREVFEVQLLVFPHSVYSYNALHKLLHAHGTVLQGLHLSLESP